MDRAWLASQLAAGRSIESLAREAGRDPSTVAYWVNRHGLSSAHGPAHAARGGLDRATLVALVEQGRSVREIAVAVDRSPTTVRHWLRRHGLTTQPARYAPRGAMEARERAARVRAPRLGRVRARRRHGSAARAA